MRADRSKINFWDSRSQIGQNPFINAVAHDNDFLRLHLIDEGLLESNGLLL